MSENKVEIQSKDKDEKKYEQAHSSTDSLLLSSIPHAQPTLQSNNLCREIDDRKTFCDVAIAGRYTPWLG